MFQQNVGLLSIANCNSNQDINIIQEKELFKFNTKTDLPLNETKICPTAYDVNQAQLWSDK